MPCEDGKDEISSMIRNYNRMVERTNGLIETVYKNKIREQEILVGRKMRNFWHYTARSILTFCLMYWKASGCTAF